MNRRKLTRSFQLPPTVLTGCQAGATSTHPEGKPSPAFLLGHWDAHTSFDGGPRKGQVEHASFHFFKGDDQSGTVTIDLDGMPPTGHGRWWVAGNGICYCFV